MTPISNACAGCNIALKTKNWLKCYNCAAKYDLKCANVTSKKFTSMDIKYKNTWECPECRCKKPRNIDNTDTPIRPAVDVSPGSSTGSPPVVSHTDDIQIKTCPKSLSDEMDSGSKYMTEDKFRSILKTTLEEMVLNRLSNINEKMVGFQDAMKFFNEQFEDLKNKVEEKTSVVEGLQRENEKLKTTVIDLTNRLCSVEQHMRSSNVEIIGIPEYPSENLPSTLLQLAKTVSSSLSDNDITHTTRIAKLDKESGKPRSVVVKLSSTRKRDELLAAVQCFNKKNPQDKLSSKHLGLGGPKVPVFVAEHLTPTNKHLHAATRKKAKELNYKFVWVRNGRIYVRKDEKCQLIFIRSIESLKLMC